MFIGPLAAPVRVVGLRSFGVQPTRPGFRAFAISFLLVFLAAMLFHGKAYYVVAIYPTLFPGGAVWLESKFRNCVAREVYASILAVVSLLLALLRFYCFLRRCI